MFALDLRNHGASPWADEMTYDQMADDVRAFLARQGLPAAAVIGHSMGGKVAMRLALAHGEQVERLVVVDIAPVAYQRSLPRLCRGDARPRPVADQPPRRKPTPCWPSRSTDAGVRGFLLQNLVSAEDGLAWRVPLDALADNMPELMGFPEPRDAERYEGPALFVTGGRSDYVRARASRRDPAPVPERAVRDDPGCRPLGARRGARKVPRGGRRVPRRDRAGDQPRGAAASLIARTSKPAARSAVISSVACAPLRVSMMKLTSLDLTESGENSR